MGKKNRSGVRHEKRGVRKIWVIDFRYLSKDGRVMRCRRDASVQASAGAYAEAARLMLYAAEHGTVEPPPETPTFGKFVREQFVPLVMPHYKPSTRERYERLLFKEGIITALGDKPLDQIGMREVMELLASIRARGTTPRQQHVLVRGILRRAVQLGVLARMPELPPAPKQSRKLPDAPSREVIDRLLAASSGWLRVAIALAYFANLRNGEVRGLRVCDVDFAKGNVNVRKAFSFDKLTVPKSYAERTIPMHPRLREILDDTVKGKRANDFVVADADGSSPTRQALYRRFVALQQRIGTDRIWSVHKLRHAFGTHAVASGANIEAVRELMGHRDLATTTLYVHAVAKDKIAVVAALDGQLGGNEKASSPPTG